MSRIIKKNKNKTNIKINNKKDYNKNFDKSISKNEVEAKSKDLVVQESEILVDSKSKELATISSEISVGSDGFGNTNDSNKSNNPNNVVDSNLNNKNNNTRKIDKREKLKNKCFGRLRKDIFLQEEGLLFTDNEIIFPDNDTETLIRTNRIFYYITIIFSILFAFFLLLFKSSIKTFIIANHLDTIQNVVFIYCILLLVSYIFKNYLLNHIILKVFKFYKVIDFEKEIAYSKVVSKIYTYKYNVIPFHNIIEISNNTILDKSKYIPCGRQTVDNLDFKYRYYCYEFFGAWSEVLCRSTYTVSFLLKKGNGVELYNFLTLKRSSGYTTLHNSSKIAKEIGTVLNALYGIRYNTLKDNEFYDDTQMIIAEYNNNYYLEEVEFNPCSENRFITFFKVLLGFFIILPAAFFALFLLGFYFAILMN